MSQRSNQPTPRQLQYLRTLAERSGTTFASPRTRGEASREIRRLEALPALTRRLTEFLLRPRATHPRQRPRTPAALERSQARGDQRLRLTREVGQAVRVGGACRASSAKADATRRHGPTPDPARCSWHGAQVRLCAPRGRSRLDEQLCRAAKSASYGVPSFPPCRSAVRSRISGSALSSASLRRWHLLGPRSQVHRGH